MTDDEAPEGAPVAYPVPETIVAAEPTFLAALAAVILGVLAFMRRKRRPR
jgi:MYXO-CTERM domain-containing protein